MAEKEPEFVDVIRNRDGSANWRLNFDNIYEAFNAARAYFRSRWVCDRVLIGFLVRLRHTAKRKGDYELSDTIRRVLKTAGVSVEDQPGCSVWHVECTAEHGEIPVDEEEIGT